MMCSFFHSIVLLEDEHKIPKSKLRPGYEKEKGSRKTPFLSIYNRFKKGDDPVIREIREDFLERSRKSFFFCLLFE